jgi:hypothetical protein
MRPSALSPPRAAGALCVAVQLPADRRSPGPTGHSSPGESPTGRSPNPEELAVSLVRAGLAALRPNPIGATRVGCDFPLLFSFSASEEVAAVTFGAQGIDGLALLSAAFAMTMIST